MRILFLLFFLTGVFIHGQAQTTIDSLKRNENHTYDQIPPKFPGGDSAFYAFIKKNLIWPEDTRRRAIVGITYVSFYVETDGSLSEIKVAKGFDASCDQAAIDVISKSPNWIPGEIYGVPTRIKMIVKVKFEH